VAATTTRQPGDEQRDAEVGARVDHLLVADQAGAGAVLLPVRRMRLDLQATLRRQLGEQFVSAARGAVSIVRSGPSSQRAFDRAESARS
jgi:hypothetical protein